MGEYVEYVGELFKLGTCEDLYYVRYDDLLAMIANGARLAVGNLPPKDYLDPDNGFRFRFPFPDEDGSRDPGSYHKRGFSRGVLVPWPADVLPEAEHNDISLSIRPQGERYAYNVNVRVRCPQDPEADPKAYSSRPRLLHVVQQRPFESALWVVVRCAYCGQLWRLPPEAARALVARIRGDHPLDNERDPSRDFYHELADRIEAGYSREL